MAQRAPVAVLIGGTLIAVWGAELIQSVLGVLDMPNLSLLSTGISRKYDEYITHQLVIRAAISAVGVAAGVLIVSHKRLGHWLSVLSGGALLAFATGFGWYSSVAAGKLPLKFFLTRPGFGYRVLIYPIIIAALVVVSAAILMKNRSRNGQRPASAI